MTRLPVVPLFRTARSWTRLPIDTALGAGHPKTHRIREIGERMLNQDAKLEPTGVFDAVVVGAGFAGMFMLHRLRGMGFSVRPLRGRQWCRRHLVLEPLPGRPLRRGEHAVFLPILGRAAAGVGLVRTLCAAA